MLIVAESVYDGTWASGPVAEEIIDFELMRAMRWSFADLQATPLYVRRFCVDLLSIRNRCEAEAQRRAQG